MPGSKKTTEKSQQLVRRVNGVNVSTPYLLALTGEASATGGDKKDIKHCELKNTCLHLFMLLFLNGNNSFQTIQQ